MRPERFAAFILALCVVCGCAYVAFLAYEVEQWKSTALEALELNQQFIEINDDLLNMMKERSG